MSELPSIPQMIENLAKAGFEDGNNLVHVFLGGSNQHGAAIPSVQSDSDIFGVYIETPKRALGVSEESH